MNIYFSAYQSTKQWNPNWMVLLVVMCGVFCWMPVKEWMQ